MKAYNTIGFAFALAVVVLSNGYAQTDQKTEAESDMQALLRQINPRRGNESSTNDVDGVELQGDPVSGGLATPEVVLLNNPETTIVPMKRDVAGNELISINGFKGTLEEAIELFAELSEKNIIIPQLPVTSAISFSFMDVEWRSALQSVLDTYNYELYQRVSESEIYSVRLRPEGAPDPLLVRTFVLKYATVPLAAELVRGILSEDEAKISEFASRNMLVVKASEERLREIEAIVQSIDTVRDQVYIESKFMELTDDAQKDLGIDWAVLQAYSLGTSGDITKTIEDLDSSSRTEKTYRDSEGNVYETASGYSETHRGGSSAAPWTLTGVTPSLETVTGSEKTELFASILSADQFRIALSALAQNKGVNIISNPKIIVANEEPANISIIRKEPNLRQERQQAMNDTPDTITFRLDEEQPFFEYGIKLDVRPSINTSSNITVQINPSLTRKYADKEAGQNTYPIIDEKSIQTVFNLADGQTAAIGGLTEISESEVVRKVPVLGSIPLLGRLFRWEQTVRGQKETIIFVTVGLANTHNLDPNDGMPADSELARLQMIQDDNTRRIRELSREYYSAEEEDKLNDALNELDRREQKRIEARAMELMQAEEEQAIKDAQNNIESVE